MAYTLNQGIGSSAGPAHMQRGWLLGLPVLILVLIIAAIISRHQPGSHRSGGAQTIPVISALNVSGSTGKDKNSNSPGNSIGDLNATASAQPAGGSSSFGSSTVSPITTAGGTGSIGGTGGVTGGLGGGPTGGGTGGTSVLPDCSIGQIATVNCQVPACTPEVTLAPGQKAILGVDGTCVVIN